MIAEEYINFRDVGEFINWLTNENKLPLNKILRGGKTDGIQDINIINSPQTIINLRKGHDVYTFGADYYHFPIDNKIEKYHTEQKEVRQWLNRIIKLFEDKNLKYPVLIHCLSGKDRTGIVVAALLLILNIPASTIVQEYLLSEGEVKEEWIQTAIKGIMKDKAYFNRIDLNMVRANILSQ